MIKGQPVGRACERHRCRLTASASAWPAACPPQDVATYGALCGMAALDRGQLSARLLNNVAFRELLELVPEVSRLGRRDHFGASREHLCKGLGGLLRGAVRHPAASQLHSLDHGTDARGAWLPCSLLLWLVVLASPSGRWDLHGGWGQRRAAVLCCTW